MNLKSLSKISSGHARSLHLTFTALKIFSSYTNFYWLNLSYAYWNWFLLIKTDSYWFTSVMLRGYDFYFIEMNFTLIKLLFNLLNLIFNDQNLFVLIKTEYYFYKRELNRAWWRWYSFCTQWNKNSIELFPWKLPW